MRRVKRVLITPHRFSDKNTKDQQREGRFVTPYRENIPHSKYRVRQTKSSCRISKTHMMSRAAAPTAYLYTDC